MQKKLTLSINEELIKFAHEFSQKTRQSISHIVEQYLKSLKDQSEAPGLSPKTQRLYGIFSQQPIPDKKDLRVHFHEESNNSGTDVGARLLQARTPA